MSGTTEYAYRYYVSDLGKLLRESAIRAKQERELAKTKTDKDYFNGRLLAYHEVVALMQQQAVAFGLTLQEVSLDGIDPDRDLV